ncbi:MAG: TlpA disulfide reductase family protein [Pseudomonadota bacterium]|nr:TlpA disulfide reductase family protein [Pseudomonadota bacterium]
MRKLLFFLLLFLLTETSLAQRPGEGLTLLPERPQAPDFELTDIDGDTHRLSDYRGKVLIINFWATWCPPCREEMPSMQRAWVNIKEEGILMLAVNVGEDEDRIFEFTASYPVEFPLLMDQDSTVVGAWPVRGLPTTFVVDPQGRLVYRAIGGREWDDPELLAPVRALKE